MSTGKHIDRICCIILIFTILITVVFCNAESLGVNKLPITMGYEKKLKELNVSSEVKAALKEALDQFSQKKEISIRPGRTDEMLEKLTGEYHRSTGS